MKRLFVALYPFNPLTNIKFTLLPHSFIMLKVYDVLGRVVASFLNGFINAGDYNIVFNANDYKLTSGMYFYRLNTSKITLTKKMILLK